jgi:hypothetical protein
MCEGLHLHTELHLQTVNNLTGTVKVSYIQENLIQIRRYQKYQ